MGEQELYINIDEEFAVTTSLHGVIRIVRVRSSIAKCIWSIIIIASFSICGWQIIDRIKAYFEYPTNTEVSMFYTNYLPFPAVTICNYNRYRRSSITRADKEFIKIAGDVLHLFDTDREREVNKTNKEIVTAIKMVEGNATILYAGEFNITDFSYRTGFKLDKHTLRKCEFSGKPCSQQDFQLSFTSYGTCWTFNGDVIKKNLTQNLAGAENGLRLVIDIHQEDYTERLPTGNFEIGMKFIVHAPYEYPKITSSGYAVSPGLHAYAAMRYKQNHLMTKPHGKCDESLKLDYFSVYTQTGCLIECKMKYVKKYCNCRPLFFPDDHTSKICNLTDMALCFQNTSSSFQDQFPTLCEKCIAPCHEESFPVSLSYAKISSLKIGEDLANYYQTSLSNILNNFVFLDVFFEELVTQKTEQTSAISLSSLISDIGGQLGLFLGMSILTVGEIIEYILTRLRILICNQRKTVAVSPINNNKSAEPKISIQSIKIITNKEMK